MVASPDLRNLSPFGSTPLESLTDHIASLSLPTILLILTGLTCVRAALLLMRTPVARFGADVLESVLIAVGLVFLVLRPFVVQSFYIPSASMHPTLWEGDHILVNKWIYRMHPPHYGDVVVFRAPVEAAADEREFIKRLVALPGDTVEVREGSVRVGNDPPYTRNEIRSILEMQTGAGTIPDADALPLRLDTDALYLGSRRISRDEFATLVHHPNAPVTIQPGEILRNGQVIMESYIAEDEQYRMGSLVVPPGCIFVMGDNRNQSHDSHVWGALPMDRLIGRADCIFWPPPRAKSLTAP